MRDAGDGALDPGDEYGLELALQLVEAAGGEVTVVSMGPAEALAGVQRGLAMGAHRGLLVTDPGLRGADALVTARVLAAAVARNPYDLVIAGAESTDGYTGTMPVTARRAARHRERHGGPQARVRRRRASGWSDRPSRATTC